MNQKKAVITILGTIGGNENHQKAIYYFENKKEEKEEYFNTFPLLMQNYSKDYFVDTDNYFFSIILNNLISNALKYSKDNGRVEIVIEKVKATTIIKVIDDGIGISSTELSKVFNSFYRTTNSNNLTEIKGTGLGLSIAKRLCDILAIEIEIFSEENVGTILKLSIP